MHQPLLTRFAWLSIAAAVATISLKFAAFVFTGSIGLLSDAIESVVNLAAAIMTLAMLVVAARPPDEEHAYGHSKAEYFASGVEGTLILIAAISIAVAAVDRLLDPQPIAQVGAGLVMATVASLINLGVARTLARAGRQFNSIALEADARHLMTDVWTTAGVLIGVVAVHLTGWVWLDPLLALAVAANIVWAGIQLMRRSVLGLLDTALPASELQVVREVLERHTCDGIEYHALRTRQAGTRRFVSMHILVPGHWTVQEGHHLLEDVERDLRASLSNLTVFTHIEPLEDPVSWEDTQLDRAEPVGRGNQAAQPARRRITD